MKYVLIILASCTILSCQNSNKISEPNKVGYNGALKNFMHDADVSAKVDLKDFKKTPNLYALGALEGLKGEIQIFNSVPIITSVKGNSLEFDKSFTKKASLLVYASVEEWESVLIPKDIISYEQLESYIGKTAVEKGMNTNEPFPFLLEGLISNFDWHVINWKDGDTIHTHNKHKSVGMRGSMNNRNVEMLGFYSNAHQSIFTHSETNMHIHVKTAGNGVAGHVDGLVLENGMTLKLPKRK